MKAHHSPARWCFGLVFLILQASSLPAQKVQPANAAPIPAQILSGKRVFLANAGGDDHLFEQTLFTGGPARAYNQFYAAMKSWGHYELVGAPSEADLVFEIGLTLAQAEREVLKGNSLGNPFDAKFHLQIRDPKSNSLLWGFTEPAQLALLQGKRDRNFDQALGRLIAQLQQIIAPQPPAETKNP